jgi:hypothetical protein
MTGAEKEHGYISRAQDADPYLGHIRESVAREAQSYDRAYKEGTGEGLRYTAFDRYAKLARVSLDQMQSSRRAIAEFRSQLKPLDPTEQQIRRYREVYDAIPWNDVEQTLHAARFEKPPVPNYADYVDRTVAGQEDMLLGFQELISAPAARHIFAFLLAAFIDVIIFLLAYASGPYFFGAPEERWCAAAAALDDADVQVFVRNFLRKLEPDSRGLARVDVAHLTPGERHLCLLLAGKGAATLVEDEGRRFYLLEEGIHEHLVESLSSRRLPLRTTPKTAQA